MTKDNNNIMIAPGKNHNAEAVYQIIGNAIIIKDIRQERIPIILKVLVKITPPIFTLK